MIIFMKILQQRVAEIYFATGVTKMILQRVMKMILKQDDKNSKNDFTTGLMNTKIKMILQQDNEHEDENDFTAG